MRAILAFVVGVALAGCLDPTPEVAATEVCEALCACRSPLQHAQDLCTADCEAELVGLAIPPACVTCAHESACVALDDCLDGCFAIPSPAQEEP